MAKKLQVAIAGLTAAVALASFGYEAANPSYADADLAGPQATPLQLIELGKTRTTRHRAPAEGYTAPVTFTPTSEQFDECLVIDANEDDRTWSYDGQGFKYTYSSSNEADDWCILPAIRLEAGTCKVEFSYKNQSKSYPEAFKIFIGREATIDGMTTMIADKSNIRIDEYQTEVVTTEISEAGEYYIGLYACSPANSYNLYVKDINVAMLDENQPMAPELSIAADGLDCDLTVTMPSNNIGGAALTTSVIDAKVYMDGTLLDGGEISGAPGESKVISFNVGAGGEHTFKASVSYENDGKILNSEETTVSHRFTKKQTLPTPIGYVFTPDEDEYSWCTVIDSNEDGTNWHFVDSYLPDDNVAPNAFRYGTSYAPKAANDWLILPVFDGSEGGAYQVTFSLATKYNTEKMQVYMATEPTVEALSENVIWDQEFNLENKFQNQKALFTVEEGKDFYIAFHASSDAYAGYIFIQNICVTKINGDAPAKPELSDPTFDGGDGTVTLTMPSVNLDGNALTVDKVYAEITVDGQAYGSDVEGAPGEAVAVAINGLERGNHEVEAKAYIIINGEKVYSEPVKMAFKTTVSSDFKYDLPLELDLNSSIFDLFVTVNANGDHKEWGATGTCFELPYNSAIAADDWVISPAVELNDPTKAYELSVTARNSSSSYEEKFEVMIGRAQTVDGMTISVIPVTTLKLQNYDEWKDVSGIFSVPEAGRYYIGIHGVSDRDKMNFQVKHLSLKESNITPLSPAAAEGLAGDGLETGELTADVTFTFPTKTFGGADLDVNADLTATVTSPAETKTVVGKPGTQASLQIACPQGNSEIKVIVSNESGDSPEASLIVNCGLDRPKTPVITRVECSEDNLSATVHFEPVTEGANGGHANAGNMDYYLFEWDPEDEDWYQIDVQENVTSLTFDVPAGSPQTVYTLAVQCYNGLNSGSEMAQFSVTLGAPKSLPMEENFEGGQLHHSIAVSTGWMVPEWSVVKPEEKVAGATSQDGGYALYGHTAYYYGESYLYLPKFSTEGIENPTLQLVTYKHEAGCEITILGSTHDSEENEVLGTIDVPSTTEGWANLFFPLPEALKNRKWAEIHFYVNFPGGSSSIPLIDAYRVLTNNPNAIDGVADDAVKYVRGGKGAIAIAGYAGADLMVSNLAGQTVSKGTGSEGVHYIVVEPGVYVVKAGADSYKVLVK